MTSLRQRMIQDMQIRNLAVPTYLEITLAPPELSNRPPFRQVAGNAGTGGDSYLPGLFDE